MKTIYLLHIHDYAENDSNVYLYSDLNDVKYVAEFDWLGIEEMKIAELLDYLQHEDHSILRKDEHYEIRLTRIIL